MQFSNSYICSGDVEGHVMAILGQKVVDRLNTYGAPSIQAQRFWSTQEDAWYGVADGAAAWGDLVVAFHTDSAGNQDNDGRGYTGSVLCFKGADQAGRKLGWTILNRMLTDFGWVIHREEDRSELYMFNINDTPACLLELGNHSDPDDCKFMLANLDKFADSIAWGIFEYLGINPRKDTATEEEEEVFRLIQFQGENAYRLVDFGQRTKWTVPNPAALEWLHSFGIPQVSGPQPFGEIFQDIDDREVRDNGTSDRIIAMMGKLG